MLERCCLLLIYDVHSFGRPTISVGLNFWDEIGLAEVDEIGVKVIRMVRVRGPGGISVVVLGDGEWARWLD